MSHDQKKKLKIDELESMRRAVEDGGIQAIHPDKLEEWGEYLVRQLKKQYTIKVFLESMKYLYLIDHFIPFPQSEYGGQWSVIADNDEQCFDVVVCEDEELNIGCYGKLRENISKASKFALVDEERSRVVSSFLT